MPPGVALIVTFRGSNYRCLEQIFMVPKGFEPSKFDCISYTHKHTHTHTRAHARHFMIVFWYYSKKKKKKKKKKKTDRYIIKSLTISPMSFWNELFHLVYEVGLEFEVWIFFAIAFIPKM